MRRTRDFDAKDRAIVNLLEKDARQPISEIARLTSLSPPSVADRIARLRDIGVIRGFAAQVNAERIGLPVGAIIEFRPRNMTDDQAGEFLSRFPEFRDCYRVTGKSCFAMIAWVADHAALRELLENLYKHGDTSTSVILSVDFEQRPLTR